jgi:hypothetical protein
VATGDSGREAARGRMFFRPRSQFEPDDRLQRPITSPLGQLLAAAAFIARDAAMGCVVCASHPVTSPFENGSEKEARLGCASFVFEARVSPQSTPPA